MMSMNLHSTFADHAGHSPSGNSSVILAADNMPRLRYLLESELQNQHSTLLFASTGDEVLRRFDEFQPDLVLLDVDLPGTPSWEVCQSLLTKAQVPIVFLAQSYQEDDAVRALRLGAVDYVPRTVPPQVLFARARAALRRKEAFLPPAAPQVYNDGYLQIDLAAQAVFVEDKPVELTTTEYKILIYLLKKAGQVCPKDQILSQIWGAGYETCLHYVHLYIGRLRKKIEQVPNEPKYLISVYGKGYYFQLDGAST